MAIKGGKIVYVGDRRGAQAFVGRQTRVEDIRGGVILPGLVDAHIHPLATIDHNVCSLQSKALDLPDLVRTAKLCTKKLDLQPGQWISLTQWEYGAGNAPGEGFRDLREALDAVSLSHPVVMTGWDGHHAAFNSVALAMARGKDGRAIGLSAATLKGDMAAYRDFVGVRMDGEPSGAVNDAAKALIDRSQLQRDGHRYVLENPHLVSGLLARSGITAILEAKAGSSDYEIYDRMLATGGMNFWTSIAQFYAVDRFRDASGAIGFDRLFADADAVRSKYASSGGLVSADFIKIQIDGSVESNPHDTPPSLGNSPLLDGYKQPLFAKDADGNLSVTGYVDQSSADCEYARAHPDKLSGADAIAEFRKRHGFHPAQCTPYAGVTNFPVSEIDDYVREAHLRRYAVHLHVIGDAATRIGIDAIEKARRADGKSDLPDGLAHIEFATPEDVKRMGRNKLFLAYTYSWMYAEPDGYDLSLVPFYNKVKGRGYEAFHEPSSAFEQNYYPVKTAKDAGAILVAGSDAPVLTNEPQPFVNMRFAMTRARPGLQPTSPWQRLTIDEVLDAYTIDGARSIGRGDETGSLEVGKSADFILIDRDVVALGREGDADAVGATEVLQTWFRGRKVYSSPKQLGLDRPARKNDRGKRGHRHVKI